ncbi:neuronal acetylcholine receptor subunit beta-3 [Patella vulgata]|uniref:neuronal acetylcholine receptor subunit beta-3 n=1 Tax=Patella vulgata TaxID=6465 RepID=UPI0024A9D51C|nr:neuronal acetylcholine receptor subunit beta-3 [Patella vulgata]
MDLTSGYSSTDRPEKVTIISISFSIMSIDSLDVENEQFSVNGLFVVRWSDSRLTWTPSDYGDIHFQLMKESKIWVPAFIVDNSVNDLSVISDESVLVRANYEGIITWWPPGIYKSACDANIFYFPFDTQTCQISLTSYGYTTQEVDLNVFKDGIDLSLYQPNGEWLMLANETSIDTFTNAGLDFRRITFSFEMKRRPAFYGVFYILPILINSLLTVYTFALTPESGEKIAFCLTMMLSYTVLVTLLSEQLPSSGKISSVLTIYMAIVMVLCAIAVPLAIWVIDLFHRKDSEPIPKWQIQFTENVLLKIGCRKKKISRLNAVGAVKIKGDDEASPVTPVQVVYNDHVDLYTPLNWKDLASILDSVLFRVYFITVVLTTVIVFTRMVLNI